MVKSRCLRVSRERGQAALTRLAGMGLLRKELRPGREGDSVLLPMNDGKYDGEGELCERDFMANRIPVASYRDLAQVPAALKKMLPRAFDVIGKVIIIKIPGELAPYQNEIGRALLAARPQARSVANDRGVKGEDRVRQLEVIAGEPDLETVHVEHGLRFAVDPSKVYFSPRLATERLRVARLVKEGESVLDMFAGVGPFSIHIARRARPSVVFAVDINPAAIDYLKRNISLDRAVNVEPVLADARKLAGRIPPVDRIIMNLPHSASDFLPFALGLLRPGGTVHLYEIMDRGKVAERRDAIAAAVERAGRKVKRADSRLVRGYSRLESHFVLDTVVD
jgi:tRNA (guanine37-N1)-methyltransferase